MGTRTRIVGGILAASLLTGGLLFALDGEPKAAAQAPPHRWCRRSK